MRIYIAYSRQISAKSQRSEVSEVTKQKYITICRKCFQVVYLSYHLLEGAKQHSLGSTFQGLPTHNFHEVSSITLSMSMLIPTTIMAKLDMALLVILASASHDAT